MLDEPFDGLPERRSYRLRQTPDEEGEPVSRMVPRSLMIPPGIPDFATRDRTLDPGRHCPRPRLVGARAGRARRGERRRRRHLGGRAARPAALAAGVALMGVGLGRHAQPGDYELCCRATDGAGNTQPLEAPWNLGGYANNEVHRVPVVVRDD